MKALYQPRRAENARAAPRAMSVRCARASTGIFIALKISFAGLFGILQEDHVKRNVEERARYCLL